MAQCPYCEEDMDFLKESNGVIYWECPHSGHKFIGVGVLPLLPIASGDIIQDSIINDISQEDLDFVRSLPVNPGEKKIVSIERSESGNLKIDYV